MGFRQGCGTVAHGNGLYFRFTESICWLYVVKTLFQCKAQCGPWCTCKRLSCLHMSHVSGRMQSLALRRSRFLLRQNLSICLVKPPTHTKSVFRLRLEYLDCGWQRRSAL